MVELDLDWRCGFGRVSPDSSYLNPAAVRSCGHLSFGFPSLLFIFQLGGGDLTFLAELVEVPNTATGLTPFRVGGACRCPGKVAAVAAVMAGGVRGWAFAFIVRPCARLAGLLWVLTLGW